MTSPWGQKCPHGRCGHESFVVKYFPAGSGTLAICVSLWSCGLEASKARRRRGCGVPGRRTLKDLVSTNLGTADERGYRGGEALKRW